MSSASISQGTFQTKHLYLAMALVTALLIGGSLLLSPGQTAASSEETVGIVNAELFLPAVFRRSAREVSGITYKVKAENARLNRKVLGDVVVDVQGVPAEPVHSFVWDGEGSVPIEGSARLEIDPVNNTGEITAQWSDRNGDWEFTQTMFGPAGAIPDHPSGYQLGSTTTPLLVTDDPVTNNVYLHGDTTAGEPVLPTIFNLIATWGPAELTLNGEPFENPFDGPAPKWVAHTMTTAGVRNEDGKVLAQTNAGQQVYNPTLRSEPGVIDDGDVEFHIVFHDAPGPSTDNFPPPLSFFYHVMFEGVEVSVIEGK